MKFQRFLLATASLCATAFMPQSSSAAPLPLDQAAKIFAARQTAFAPDISPNGSKLLYMSAGPGAVTYLHLRDLASKQDNVILQSSGKPEQLSFCGFASETWAVCRFMGEISRRGTVLSVVRLTAINLQTGQVRRLGVADNSVAGGFVQFDGSVIDWLPEKDATVLVERNYPDTGQYGEEGSGVDEINLDTFKITPVIHSSALGYGYVTDGHGAIRLRGSAVKDDKGRYMGKVRYDYMRVGSDNWEGLLEGDRDLDVLAVDRKTNSVFFLKPLDGRDALYQISLDGSRSQKLVASNPRVDIDGILVGGVNDDVVGYSYNDEKDHAVYTDPAAKALADQLGKAVPDLPLINFGGRHDKNGRKILLHASSDVDPGAYFVLDKSTMNMAQVLASNANINPAIIAPMKAVTIPTSDGKSIPGYLTMAKDLGPGPHPTIVLPHGGPTSRDTWGYDWLVQFLASRGYAVLQPNYRGSAGYGKEFLGQNAFHGWRQVMSDLKDSTDWLVKEKIAEPDHMAIVGWSYGGYAALEAGSMDPRYKAVVAIAPVTDLKLLRSESQAFTNSDLQREEIGKGDLLGDGSPVNRAASIKAPVLLVHGTLDGNVSYDHSKRMASAISKSGGKVELQTFTDLDHQLSDSDARLEMLTKMGQLLDRTIGRK